MESIPPLNIGSALRSHVERHKVGYLDAIVGLFYLWGVWEHLPYAGGWIYSDLDSVFQSRFCPSNFSNCYLGMPYVNVFVEYPPITGFFMWSMGVLAKVFSFWANESFITNYYGYTVILLLIPTVLLVDETLKIARILGIRQRHRRTLLFLVATPTFVFMLLLNWYIIGVWLAVFGLRKFLEGSRWFSGLLLGFSAAANLVTAVPALGMLFGANNWRERLHFIIGGVISFGAVYGIITILNSFPHQYMTTQFPGQSSGVIQNIPFMFPNTSFISYFFDYNYNWYIEGSWMLAFMNNLDPIRHVIFPALFLSLCALIVYVGIRKYIPAISTAVDRADFIVTMSWLFTFAFLFSTYVCTPQMNLILLPFFVLVPIVKYYPEFLAFDIVNALVIVYPPFSEPLRFLGINLPPAVPFGPIWVSQIQLLAVVRSFWIGKFLIVDGLLFPRKFASKDLTRAIFSKLIPAKS